MHKFAVLLVGIGIAWLTTAQAHEVSADIADAEPATTVNCSCVACDMQSYCAVPGLGSGTCHTETWTVETPNVCDSRRPINCCPGR